MLSSCPRQVDHWLCGPVFAQEKDAVDPQAVQQRDLLGVAKALEEFGELSLKVDEAINKNDAAAVAAFDTEDGIFVTSEGPKYGREAIEKFYGDLFPAISF